MYSRSVACSDRFVLSLALAIDVYHQCLLGGSTSDFIIINIIMKNHTTIIGVCRIWIPKLSLAASPENSTATQMATSSTKTILCLRTASVVLHYFKIFDFLFVLLRSAKNISRCSAHHQNERGLSICRLRGVVTPRVWLLLFRVASFVNTRFLSQY